MELPVCCQLAVSGRGTLTWISELLSLSHSCAFAAESQRVGKAEQPALEMSDILQELLRVSEKAANIARACRQQEALFQLLIQEKKDGEKNKKFAADFKTLADVLVQEVIKHNMENKVRGQGQGGCEAASLLLTLTVSWVQTSFSSPLFPLQC